jgi:hypothetical protein
MLKRMGVGVIFEKEGIDTTKEFSEFIFTIHSSMAQAESESLSGNVKIGTRMSFKRGKVPFIYKGFLGYTRGDDGMPMIVHEEAAVIKKIYGYFLEGMSYQAISNTLTEQGVLTPKNKNKWCSSTVKSILTNEKYMGDAIQQKTFIEDFLIGKSVKNTGQLPMYYVENNHEPIIDKGTWNRVQEEIARRSSLPKSRKKNAVTELGKYCGKYALTGILVCGGCGSQYRRVVWRTRDGMKKYVWRCVCRLDYGKKYCTDTPSIEESVLHQAVMNAVMTYVQGDRLIIGVLMEDVSSVIGEGSEGSLFSMQLRRRELNQMMSELIDNAAESNAPDAFDPEFEKLGDEIRSLETRINEAEKTEKADSAAESRLKDMYSCC